MTHRRPRIAHVHASGHFKATAAQMTEALNAYRSLAIQVITLTEVSPDHLRRPLAKWAHDNGMRLHHPTGPGQRECAVLSEAPLVQIRVHRLSNLLIHRGTPVPVYLILARTAYGPWFAVWHSPAHNAGLDPRAAATRIYVSALRGLHIARLRIRGHRVVLAADWNLDLQRASVRARLSAPYPGMTWGWHDGQAPTLGNRVIDGVLTNLPIEDQSVTLPHKPGYDHAAVLTVYAAATTP